MTALVIVLLSVGMGWVCADAHAQEEQMVRLEVTSTAFKAGARIPTVYTCDGDDTSPQLAWSAPPEATKSVAIICDDPDAPWKTWVHWVVYQIRPEVRELKEALPQDAQFEDGTRQGRTDFGRVGYGGPCPPSGTHRYFFKVYALDIELTLAPGATKAQLEAAMKGHVVAEGSLMGTYSR